LIAGRLISVTGFFTALPLRTRCRSKLDGAVSDLAHVALPGDDRPTIDQAQLAGRGHFDELQIAGTVWR
jgi:hypothetical protein